MAAKPLDPNILSRQISGAIIKAFRAKQWFMTIFGKFPYKVKRRFDGTSSFELAPIHYPQTLWFYLTTIIATLSTIGMLCGIFLAFYHITTAETHGQHVTDRCGNTWEATVFTRHFNVIMFFLSCSFNSTFTGIYIWIYREEICNFMNYFSTIMQKIQFDPTTGLQGNIIMIWVLTSGMAVLAIILFATGQLTPMEESSAFFLQSIAFFYPQFYARKTSSAGPQPLNISNYIELSDLCLECEECSKKCPKLCSNVISEPPVLFRVLTGVAFAVLFYIFASTMAFHSMFLYFCRALINTSRCWNNRFSNAVSQDRHEDIKDEFRRRIQLKPLCLDFGLVVEMYQMTEETFGYPLAAVYFSLLVNIITHFYYLALMTVQRTCSEWIIENLNMDMPQNPDPKKTPEQDIGMVCDNWESIVGIREGDDYVSFESPCQEFSGFRRKQALVALALMTLIFTYFMVTIWEGHYAVSEGVNGFQRLRKFNYMGTRELSETYFVHTLKLVYLGPCAIHISASNFFIIRRRLSILVFAAVSVYLMMLLGFGPGGIIPRKSCEIRDNIVFEYPKITGYG